MSRRSSGTLKKADAQRRLIVSFHDLHPGTRDICARFLDRLAELGVRRTSLLVVPCWHRGPACTDDPAFVDWLQQRAAAGHDICLHGFYHRAAAVTGGPIQRLIGRHYTTGEGEFYQIDLATATRRVRDGLQMLARDAGLPIRGFTAPAWLLSPAGRQALIDAGLRYNTMHGHVELLREGRKLPAPTVVYSCRNAWRRLVSRLWAVLWTGLNRSAPLLRIAAHPGDFADPRLERSLYDRIHQALGQDRRPVTYCDLLPDGANAPPRGVVPA